MLLIVDIIAVLILSYFFFKGFRRGFIISVLGIVGLICAYIGAYLLYQPLGSWFQERYELPNIAAYAVGGLCAFICIYLFFSVISGFISWRRRRMAKKDGVEEVGLLDKVLGGALGVVIGGAVVVMLFWLYNMAQISPVGKKLPDLSGSASARASEAAVRSGAYAIAKNTTKDKDLSNAIARSVSNPLKMTENVQKIMEHPKVEALSADPEFLGSVLHGDEELIRKNPALNDMLEDPEVMNIARELGLVAYNEKPEELKDEAAKKLARIGRNFGKIQNDPEIQAILNDRDVQAKLESQDIAGLLKDQKFHKLIKRVMEVSGAGEE